MDKYLFDTQRFEFFQGYLFGVVIGWLIFFLSTLILFVLWKNTKELRHLGLMFTLGQVAFSIPEVISFGISDNPQLQREQERQSSVDAVKTEIEVSQLRERRKRENPERYVEFEEQSIQREQKNIELQLQELQELKDSLRRTAAEPEKEAEDLLHFKDNLTETLNAELELARARYDEDHERTQQVVSQYEQELQRQRALRSELEGALNRFKDQGLSKTDFSRIVSYQKITQYESGGVILGEFTIGEAAIKIYQGDITNLIVDAIVISDDNYLTTRKRVRSLLLSQ